jgi:hypothetical protein
MYKPGFEPIFEDVQPHEEPSIRWLSDGDWVHFAGIIIWLLQTFLAIAFCVTALVAFSRNEVGYAIVMALLSVALKPTFGWRG